MPFYLAWIYSNFSRWNFKFFSISDLSYGTNQDFMPLIQAQFFFARYPQKLHSEPLQIFILLVFIILTKANCRKIFAYTWHTQPKPLTLQGFLSLRNIAKHNVLSVMSTVIIVINQKALDFHR